MNDSNYVINKASVKWAREIIEYKKPIWEAAFPEIQFDENGRAKVGLLPLYTEAEFQKKIRQSSSKLFKECLAEAYKELRLKPISLTDIQYAQYVSKRIIVETETGNIQERSLPSILGRASAIWERKMPLYRPLRNIYKPMAKARENQQNIDCTKDILSKMEHGNTYISYDELMRIFQAKDIYISINPLDKLFSSGGPNTGSITNFRTCWTNDMDILDNGKIEFSPEGEYSNPKAQVVLGAYPMCGMLMVPNGNTIKFDEMEFHGMLQRSHIWLDRDAIFMENLYPDKSNETLRASIISILDEKVQVRELESGEKKTIKTPKSFNAKKWAEEYEEARATGLNPYLDRSSISKTGIVKIF